MLVAPPDVDAEDIEPRLLDFRPLPRLRLPFPSIVAASRNDPFCRLAGAEEIAWAWGSDFVDAGHSGHINADAPIGTWADGLPLLSRLSGHNANLLVTELGLRTALA